MTLSSLVLALGIGLAGAMGAVARYLLGRFVAERSGSQFPFGTFLINVSGAFLIGLIYGLTTQKVVSLVAQTVLATGFLGGFTTFSTLNWEGVQLARGGSRVLSLLYFSGSFALGLGAAFLGMMIGRGL